MQPCKSILIRTGLIFLSLLVTIPAFSQRGTLGIDAGVTTDKYGDQPQTSAPDFGIDGKFNLLKAKDGGPKVQPQPALAGAAGTTWVERLLAEAVVRLVAEDFPATPGDACARCDYVRCCPAQPAGRQVVG